MDQILKKIKTGKFKYDGGILEFVEFLNEKKEKLKNKNGNDLFKKPIYIEGKKGNIEIECALQMECRLLRRYFRIRIIYFKKMEEHMLLGFRSALTRIINKYANEHNLLKKNKLSISGDDIKEGLSCVLSIKCLIQNFHLKQKIN